MTAERVVYIAAVYRVVCSAFARYRANRANEMFVVVLCRYDASHSRFLLYASGLLTCACADSLRRRGYVVRAHYLLRDSFITDV